jgi:exodeoxyribonuclease V gamma subunit
MSDLNLYTSNRLEILADKLAEVLHTPLASPIEPEIIVVQSKGMERWISMEIARRFGICANVRFPFPNAFIYEMIGKVIPDLPEQSPFDPKFLTWKIMKILPTFIKMPGFESIKNYLDKGGFDLKGFQLAERIADLFDQYLLYRPEWIFRWEKGEEDHWQAVLWRELVMSSEHIHRAALGKKLVELLQNQGTNFNNFPQRVSVFGISALPLFHIQILAAISQFAEINLFLMNPCQEYWFDILSDREIKRVTDRYRDRSLPEVDTHAEKGNSLLASMGSLGRDFLGIIYDFDVQESADFVTLENDSLLSHIQSDILNLRDREKSSTKTSISENDDSIQVHSCHSSMREIEVLQDQLLKMFEQNPGLLPKDILVMAPDIEVYAPYIQAVFDLPLDDPRRIPFSITDRNVRKESQIIEAFLAILDLWDSRFGAAQVMTILESPTVRLKFEISEAEIDMIRQWISDTRIRWGIDKDNRRNLGLPATSENTWQAGLERLLLGYAMPGEGDKMFADILPYDHVEGSETVALGNFVDFSDRLFKTVESMGQPRTLEQWSDFLQRLMERFFETSEDTQNQLMVVWQALNELVNVQNESGFTEKINIQIIRNYLEHQLERVTFGYGFMTGGVTFCSMLPMRSIPFKVICLIGMNDTAYPRQEPKLGFNLLAKHPRQGDRSRRKDDRYLFLEALLSAREKLYISYVGQSIQDNSTIPPSVLVSELLDYIETGFEIPGEKILDHLVTKHRLQAFSPVYFKGNKKLFSYSNEHFQAAKRLTEPRQTPLRFISAGLTTPGDEWKQVEIADLSRFFLNPAKFLLNKRLGIYLGEESSILDENESFVMEYLDRYLLEQNLLDKKLDGRNLKEYLMTTKASGMLPHGTVGDCVFENLSSGVEHFVQQSQQYIQTSTLEPLNVDLSIAGFHLTGQIEGINSERLLRYRFAKIKGKDRLRTWIDHLILNCIDAENYPRVSLLIGLNPDSRDSQWAAWEFSPIDNSRKILEQLLAIYWEGLIKPIHFFPESSWEYANRVLEKNKSVEDALKNARNVWTGSDYNRGEFEDLNYQLCFKNRDPIDGEFQDLAIEIFKPMIEVQKKIS